MRNALRVVAVLAAGFACAASATSQSNSPECPPAPAPCGPPEPALTWNGPPAIVRSETVREAAPVDGIEVSVTPVGLTAWRLQIKNTTNAVMTFLYDESTFVASTGVSGGRLINGNTRRMDTAKAQPGEPIAPSSSFVGTVFVEKLIVFEDAEDKGNVNARKLWESSLPNVEKNKFGSRMNAKLTKNRSDVAPLIIGGKIYITVQAADGKKTWSGEIAAPSVETK